MSELDAKLTSFMHEYERATNRHDFDEQYTGVDVISPWHD